VRSTRQKGESPARSQPSQVGIVIEGVPSRSRSDFLKLPHEVLMSQQVLGLVRNANTMRLIIPGELIVSGDEDARVSLLQGHKS